MGTYYVPDIVLSTTPHLYLKIKWDHTKKQYLIFRKFSFMLFIAVAAVVVAAVEIVAVVRTGKTLQEKDQN